MAILYRGAGSSADYRARQAAQKHGGFVCVLHDDNIKGVRPVYEAHSADATIPVADWTYDTFEPIEAVIIADYR